MSRHSEAEAAYGHPLQYALVNGPGLGGFGAYVGETGNLDNDQVLTRLRGMPAGCATQDVMHALDHRGAYHFTVERYNRCPTCEQWSPCEVRRAEALLPGEAAGVEALATGRYFTKRKIS